MGKSNKFSLTTKSHSSTRVNPYDKITLNALNVSCPDKRIILPKLDGSGVQHVFIELYSLIIFIIALGTQYLNLYRSVWWLSKTRGSQPINYHLIDLDVSQFSLIFIGQSSLICILRALLNKATIPTTLNLLAQKHQPSSSISTSSSSDSQHKHQQHQTSPQTQTTSTSSSPNTLATIVTASASWICNYYLFKCAYRIWSNFGLNGVSCILYPIVSIELLIIILSYHDTRVSNAFFPHSRFYRLYP